jgi:hypothetical protein
VVSTVGRTTAPGRTRVCPHCKATILESASVCPACHHHLRFDPKAAVEKRIQATSTPLRVEGLFRHPAAGGAWEYSVVVSICNERGEEIARKVVGVGALQPNEARTFTVSVDVYAPPK